MGTKTLSLPKISLPHRFLSLSLSTKPLSLTLTVTAALSHRHRLLSLSHHRPPSLSLSHRHRSLLSLSPSALSLSLSRTVALSALSRSSLLSFSHPLSRRSLLSLSRTALSPKSLSQTLNLCRTRPSGLPPLSTGDWSLGSPKPSPMFVVCRRLDSGESDESFVETSTNLGSIMDLFRVGVGVVANLVEYLVGPLRLGLKDSNGYVRMVAAIGAFKLYHISAATCVDADFPSMLKSLMLHDSDSQLGPRPRGIGFKDFMNLLEDRLQHANGDVVLA
ncbi:hypothetical protein Syun_027586 [Stephania yunnanensis]|uniref:Condensin complex subunit 1 C-terminal domain-containing protein n=1 Tax=Stephania yunnanensis TaxID=152371 RepID=A0AAP0EI79_9MAGN